MSGGRDGWPGADAGLEAWATALAQRVAAGGLPPRCGTTRLICVDGPSGAGKTEFAALLAARLPGACVAHMDELYGGWDGLDRAWPALRGSVLEPLAAGTPAAYRAYDWAAGAFTGRWRAFVPGSTLIAEGCGSAPRQADAWASAILWLDAPAALRRERALARDGAEEAPLLDAWALAEAAHYGREDTAARAHWRLWTE